MAVDSGETQAWTVEPVAALAERASALLRGMVQFVIESTDEPDSAPERFERTLEIATSPTAGESLHFADDRDENYDCWADITPWPSRFVGASLTVDRADRSAHGVRALVQEPDSSWVLTELGRAGFELTSNDNGQGRPLEWWFSRGAVNGWIGVLGSGRLDVEAEYVSRVVMTWSSER